MERIILEVDERTGKKWRAASMKLKTELSKFMEKQITIILDSKKDIDSIQYFNELREEMSEKGLTQEILDSILKDEE
jgi:hypothetical protein